MLKKTLTAFAVAGTLICGSTHAANLSIKGSIVPGACSVNLGDGGVVTYDYSASEARDFLVHDAAYAAPEKKIGMKVECAAPTKFSISLEDNRRESVSGVNDTFDSYGYGLGVTRRNQNIGQYRVSFANLKAAASAAGPLQTPSSFIFEPAGVTKDEWSISYTLLKFFLPGFAVGMSLDSAPDVLSPISRLEGDLSILSYFDRNLIDNMTEAIELNGSSTFHIHYH